MNNFNINRQFVLVFAVIVLVSSALIFVFWLGYRAGPSTVKSEVVWSHGDFSDTKTSILYADPGTEITSETNNKLTRITETETPTDTVYVTWECPVCKDKGLTSQIYLGLGHATLTDTYYESFTNWSCSLGHEWKVVWKDTNVNIEITKDTEDKSVDIVATAGLGVDMRAQANIEELYPKISEDEFIQFGLNGEVIISLVPMTSMTFGGNVGKITWDNGIMKFEGDAAESAKLFFEDFLKPIVDKYIESELEKEETEPTIEVGEMILFRHVTSGEFAREFKPTIFLDVVNTDLSECIIDGRLKLNLNDEIYWIRLEKDDE